MVYLSAQLKELSELVTQIYVSSLKVFCWQIVAGFHHGAVRIAMHRSHVCYVCVAMKIYSFTGRIRPPQSEGPVYTIHWNKPFQPVQWLWGRFNEIQASVCLSQISGGHLRQRKCADIPILGKRTAECRMLCPYVWTFFDWVPVTTYGLEDLIQGWSR